VWNCYHDEWAICCLDEGNFGSCGTDVCTRAPIALPQLPNERWSLDFLSDQLVDGRRFRIRVVVDDCTRECLLLVADTSLSDARVARELDWLMAERGKPKMLVSDNGTELTSTAILCLPTITRSPGIISRLVSRRRTPSSKASTDGCATSSWR
jgi:putative transposase